MRDGSTSGTLDSLAYRDYRILTPPMPPPRSLSRRASGPLSGGGARLDRAPGGRPARRSSWSTTPAPSTRALAELHGARYVAHDGPLGLNAARNTGVEHRRRALVFVDDDVEVAPAGWRRCSRPRASTPSRRLHRPISAAPGGPPLPRSCGREGPRSRRWTWAPRDATRATLGAPTWRSAAAPRAGRPVRRGARVRRR